MSIPLFARLTRVPDCCAVCGRQASPKGFFNKNGAAHWVCPDDDCVPAAAEIADMPAQELTNHETMALMEAGDAAGGFLDGIGKTDLAELTELQFQDFTRTLLTAFGSSMRRRCTKNPIPF